MSHSFRHLDLFVTEACNLACPYCFARERGETPPLSVELARRAIVWLCESTSSRVHVTFWGGEPLLRLSWLREVSEEIQNRARDAGKSVTMSLPTNATLLDEAALDWIERFNVKIFLSIDGDGMTQAGRPLACGGSSHDLASQGLRNALNHRPRRPVTVRMTVTPANVHRLPDNVRYFASQGVRRLMVYPAYDQPWTSTDVRAFGKAERRVAEMLAAWLCEMPDPHEPIRLDGWVPILRLLAGLRKVRLPKDCISSCGVGDSLVALNLDGCFSPCHRFTFYGRSQATVWEMGNLSKGLAGDATKPFQGLIWEKQHGEVPCPECDLFPMCSMGCVAINFAATQDLLRVPSWACALQRERIQACRLLHDTIHTHPAYAAYLGQDPSSILQNQANEMGKRAAKLWMSLSQPRNESWQSST